MEQSGLRQPELPIEHTDNQALVVDHYAEARLVRKLDLNIIPITMFLYFFSFLDRVNIGNARLYGLEDDLGLVGNQYQTAVSLLFVTYVLSELPSNLVLKKFHPSRQVATLTGVVQSYGGLIACRLILGALEGGLFPGMVTYLTLFYTKKELALRVGYLCISAAIAGACGGLLAFAIGHMDGIAGQKGWRWIMIMEGIPTLLLGIFTCLLFALMIARRNREIGQTASAQKFHKQDVKLGLKDWKIYAFCLAQFGVDTMLYGYSTFLPTIIKGINPHWSIPIVQLLTIPCYALGAITYLITVQISDRSQRRGIPTVVLGIVSVIGYAMLMSNGGPGVHYAGCFFVAMGLYVCAGFPVAGLSSNNPRYGKRTTATGLQVTVGNMSGIMAPFLYPSAEGPHYLKGHGVTFALVAFAVVLFGCMSLYFSKVNHSRASGGEDGKFAGLSSEDVGELGDRSPRFIFTIRF
ncbi:MFS general substrate transporter [Tothia fuscella]|uniref:MFS general substrate transporter n=1 Tax=Tothia fuscella TaxID=1048955 RepID=A0A9P4TWR7_9PEZI|nr:MFS general substrate transporter [Tothia fuscella]